MASIFEAHDCACIWIQGGCEVNQYADFLHVFTLERACSAAKLYISVDTEYAAFLNGHFWDCGQYDDYPDHKAYDVLDVSAFLRVGENRLCVRAYHQGEDSMQYVAGTPMLIYALVTDERCVVSGADTLCRPSPDYVSGPEMDRLTVQLSFSFRCDARAHDAWLEDAYAPGEEWTGAQIQAGLRSRISFYERPVRKLEIGAPLAMDLISQGHFIRAQSQTASLARQMYTDYLGRCPEESLFEAWRPAPPYQRREACLPGRLRLLPGEENVYLTLDMRQEQAGLFFLHLDAGAGTRVEVCYGEHIKDLRVRSYIDGRNFAFSYVCGEGEQRFTHYFKRLGGRYLQIQFSEITRPLTLYYAGVRPVSYPVETAGTFVSADRLMNRIVEVCDKTLRLCMHEHYEDSPWREQALYSMDSRNQMLPGYYLYDNWEFALAGLTLLAEHGRADGLLQNASPSAWPVTMPSFPLEWILSLRDFVLYTGRIEEAKGLFASAQNILRAVAAYDDGTLLATPNDPTIWNFYEWAPGLDDLDGLVQKRVKTPQYDAPLNALFCMALGAARELAGWFGFAFDEYQALSQRISASFFPIFWDEEQRALASYADHGRRYHHGELTQAWALLADLVPPAHCQSLRDRLADPENGLVKCTISYCLFKYEALLRQPERFGRAVFDDIAEKWGGMLYQGANAFWETLPGADDFGGAGSLCHGWTGMPAYFLFAYALGIKPLEPGFARYAFEPVDLGANAEGRVRTAFGDIVVRIQDGQKSARRLDRKNTSLR